ncbi:RING-H2 finger protein ATL68 [Spatholobus suberectus]|nr:RING-H2 finger protein ATL68 [Spatholobus suberectus]
MSSFNPFSPPPPPTPYLTNLGFGYSIAIALGVLFLLSTLILSSYLCCRTLRHRNNRRRDHHSPDGIVLPRVIFVAEDEDDDDDDRHQNDVVSGLDQAVINSYPKFPYVKDGGYDGTCSICLCEYKESEMLRMMPECRHYFHVCCLDSWLKLNGSCPVCRNSPMPTPLSTPLQEVVPLSQYAADARGRR